ncbi:hypothetical protein [Pseudorhodoplanes sp.]|uniref:hypothetical protein n=1 Tax=Pseudorhodoplanes sp. TaxID=1934341 RepID=UPI00391C28AC
MTAGRVAASSLLVLVVVSVPVAELRAEPVAAVESAASELSAAQQKPRKTQRTKQRRPAPPAAPVYRWRPADPSFDQYGRRYQPPPGLPCPIDLGYGRWTSCLNDR